MLTAPSSSISCCARRAVSLHFAKHLSSSHPQNAPKESSLKKPNVTRKSYAELPAARVLADGTVAQPLGEWHGGLKKPVIAYENTASSIPEPEHENDIREAALSPTSAVRTRKRRTKVAQPATEVGEIHQNEPAAAVVPVKRRGRRKAETVIDDSVEVTRSATPLMTEVLDNLDRYPHCILLTRVGQFYESYYGQAAEVSRLLNIKLAKRTWSGQRIDMCGFPLMHLNKYLKVLVQDHHRFVALCEEFPRVPSLGAKGGFDRRVVRIVTPGTLIDEPFLNPYENNYLLSVTTPASHEEQGDTANVASSQIGLAWIDVSTGEFYTKRTTVAALRDELVRIGPREVVLDQELSDDRTNDVCKAVSEEGCFVSYSAAPKKTSSALSEGPTAEESSPDDLTYQLESAEHSRPSTLTDEESSAVALLTAYMHQHLLESMPSLTTPSRESTSSRMQIDSHTVKALEIREGMREGGTTGSLLSVIKRTVTSSGTRLLARWLCSPSTSLTEINARQSLVAFFHARQALRQDLVQILRNAEDATRIVQKFLLGRGGLHDLIAICTTIDIWSSIRESILLQKGQETSADQLPDPVHWASISALMERMKSLDDLAKRIRSAIAQRETTISETPEPEDDVPEDYPLSTSAISVRDPRNPLGIADWTIKPEFSEQLTQLHATLKTLLADKDKLERRLQVNYIAPSLTLRASPGQGMHVHIARKREALHLTGDHTFIPLSQSGSTATFFYPEWQQLGAQISDTAVSISIAEKEAFDVLRNDVIAHEAALRRNARIVDELDVTLSFANLAAEMSFVRPTVSEDTSYHVENGRHPTVELGLLLSGKTFTPNTVTFSPDSQLHVITGPNMAGKSTLLRQTALIAILAQTGSFVPASAAKIGIVDRVFSRVGAKDDLFRDRSTFMVEMLEASDILRRATPRSLVIMDEVGRGTTVTDGMAIAFATVNHLLSVNKCRAMFATHFHELADMLGHNPDDHKGQGPFSNVAFYCTDVDELEDGFWAYAHRLRPGVNRDSHGLRVAQMAQMPETAVEVARSAMIWLKERSANRPESRLELQMLGQELASRH